MTNFVYKLNELNTRRERRFLEVKKHVHNEMKAGAEKHTSIMDKIQGSKNITKKEKDEKNAVDTKIAALIKKQAELTDDKILQQEKKRLEAALKEVARENARSGQQVEKMTSKEAKVMRDKENKIVKSKRRCIICRDITGVCWDYNNINSSQIQGYVQNVSMSRIKKFNFNTSNVVGVSEHMWTIIGSAAASKQIAKSSVA